MAGSYRLPFQTEPFLRLHPNADQYEGNDRYIGYCADLAKKIAQQIHIDYRIIPVKDGRYGSRDKNGTWDGMVGELIRGVSVIECLCTGDHPGVNVS
jgi:hypothetical protein